jgi:hypothetical protein
MQSTCLRYAETGNLANESSPQPRSGRQLPRIPPSGFRDLLRRMNLLH